MAVIQSRIDTNSEAFRANRRDMLALVEGFRALEARVRDTSNQKLPMFQKRGQLTPRQRLAHLLDRGSPFLEISTLAGLKMHDDDGAENIQGGGVIAGIGYVSGVRCDDHAPATAASRAAPSRRWACARALRAQEIALENKLPLISLVESGGANLNYQAEIFVDGGRTFANMARLSAVGIPQIAVVHGSSTAGGAYQPGLTDYVVVVHEALQDLPRRPAAAEGRHRRDRHRRGAGRRRDAHEVSGVAEYLAEDDADALASRARSWPPSPWNERLPPMPRKPAKEPRYDPDELLRRRAGRLPQALRRARGHRPPRRRLATSSTSSRSTARRPCAARPRSTARRVGIIGNNGPIDAEGSVKAAQFIQLCDQADTPLVFLQNTTGYMVGRDAERAGIVKHGSKMIQAVANARVPKLTLHIGASFGAGNYGMCGRAYDPALHLRLAQQPHRGDGPEQAAGVLAIVTEEKLKRDGKPVDHKKLDAMKAAVIGQAWRRRATALFATARLWDDGLIDPRDSRRVLALCLSICREAEVRRLKPNTFGVARM